MTFFQGKEILMKLQKGLETHLAATFVKRDEESILKLISNDMVKPSAFMNVNRIRFGSQNLAEASPLTNKGKELFGLS